MARVRQTARRPIPWTLPFTSKERMIQQAGKLGLVELVFTKASGKSLFAHHSYLMASSGVLRGILKAQDDPEQPSKIARTVESTDVAAAAAAIPALPVDDQSTETWELALGLLYPGTMTRVAVTWEKAMPLLLLADKYDMPVIEERVKAFLRTHLRSTQTTQGLTAGNVFDWLTQFSRRDWDEHILGCIDFIVEKNLELPECYLRDGIQLGHVEQLYEAMRQEYVLTDSKLKTEKARPKPTTYENAHCTSCRNVWYYLLGSRTPSPTCMWCGTNKADGYTSDDLEEDE